MLKLKTNAKKYFWGSAKGRTRKYNYVPKEKLTKMMEVTFQQRTEAKIKWAVKSYCDWRVVKLDSKDCPSEILYADICDTATLTKENLEFALCRFIVEVKKS